MKMTRCGLAGAGLLCLGLAVLPAFAAGPVAGSPASGDRPVRRNARVPADGSYNEDGERHSLWQRAHPLTIQHGVLTVDGLTVRTGLSLRVADMRYMYVYVPGVGTTLISERPFGGALEQRSAFHGRTLTVSSGGNRLQLTSAKRMRGSHSAYVRFDGGVVAGVRRPMVGFGRAALAPAVWEQDDSDGWTSRRHVRVSGRRLKTAKLCRPSAHGHELCATIREVAWER